MVGQPYFRFETAEPRNIIEQLQRLVFGPAAERFLSDPVQRYIRAQLESHAGKTQMAKNRQHSFGILGSHPAPAGVLSLKGLLLARLGDLLPNDFPTFNGWIVFSRSLNIMRRPSKR
jgi:hypothetical protein